MDSIHVEPDADWEEPPKSDPEWEYLPEFWPGSKGGSASEVYVGLAVEGDEKGNITSICSTSPPFEPIPSKRTTYIVRTADEHHLLLSLLLPKTLQEDVVVGEKRMYDDSTGLWYQYTRNRSLAVWEARKEGVSFCVDSIENWFQNKTINNSPLPQERAQFCLEFAEKYYTLYSKFFSGRPRHVYSPSSVPQRVLRASKLEPSDVPDSAQKLAYNGLHAPWAQIVQEGFFSETDDGDWVAAYASLLRSSPHFSRGKWLKSRRWQPDTLFGLLRGVVEIYPNCPISPIMFRGINGAGLVSGFGTAKGWITNLEVEWLEGKNPRREVYGKLLSISEGTWCYEAEKMPSTLVEGINLCFAIKEDAVRKGDKLTQSIAKKVNSSFVGPFLQRRQRPDGTWAKGSFFSPVYACWIYTSLKLKVADICTMAPEAIITIAVDGILSAKSIRSFVPPQILGIGPGQFKLADRIAPAISLVTLHYGREGHNSIYDWWKLVEEAQDSMELRVEGTRRLSPYEAISARRFRDAGKLISVPFVVDLAQKGGRRWPEKLCRAREFKIRSSRSLPVPLIQNALKGVV